MTALSIVIPDELAQDSSVIAKKMHISRSQFIRLAIKNEINAYRLMRAQQAMVDGFKTLKQKESYCDEISDIEQLDVHLQDDGELWWEK